MDEIIYRNLEKGDIENVLSFWAVLDGVHLHSNGEESVEGISIYLDRNPGLSYVAMCNGEIVGAILCGHDGRRGYMNHLGVSEEYRNKGIAKHLIYLAEQQLKEIGIKKEALFVLCENETAQGFYEHIGWKEETLVKVYGKLV